MKELITFIQSIPDVVWSGVIASCLTLLGVMLSNKSNTNRLREQLAHDAAEKTKERTITLRREVYLTLAEELVKVSTHLGNLPQLDLAKTNFAEGMQGFLAASSRLGLIAEPKTALLISRLSSDYGVLLLKLAEYLIPITKFKSDQKIANEYCEKSQAEINRLISEMARINESGKPDEQVFQVLLSSTEFHQKQSDKYAKERDAAYQSCMHHSKIFQRQLFIHLKEIYVQHVPVMIELRRDLGLTGDLTELETHFHNQYERMQEQINSLINKLDLEMTQDTEDQH